MNLSEKFLKTRLAEKSKAEGKKEFPRTLEMCSGCWAEMEGYCYSEIKGISCAEALKDCEYNKQAAFTGTMWAQRLKKH